MFDETKTVGESAMTHLSTWLIFTESPEIFHLLKPACGPESLPMVLKVRFEGQDFTLNVYSSDTVGNFLSLLSARTGLLTAHIKCKLIEETKQTRIDRLVWNKEFLTLSEDKWVAKIAELMDAVDAYIPLPPRPVDQPFLMSVEDVFSITGRGTVATGRIERGRVKVGEGVEIIGLIPTPLTSTVTGVEMFRKLLDEGEAGDNAGLLLRGIEKKDIRRGMVICKPGSITPHTEFKGEVYVLSKEEGGRHTPFFNKYRPQFYFRTTDVTGEVELPAGTEMVMPGDNTNLMVKLIQPIAMEKGLKFAIREGGRTVGAGQVTEILK